MYVLLSINLEEYVFKNIDSYNLLGMAPGRQRNIHV